MMVLFSVSHRKRPSSLSLIHPLFRRRILLCFVRGLPVQIGAMGEKGFTPPSLGVTWVLNNENCAGLGDKRGLTSHTSSETH